MDVTRGAAQEQQPQPSQREGTQSHQSPPADSSHRPHTGQQSQQNTTRRTLLKYGAVAAVAAGGTWLAVQGGILDNGQPTPPPDGDTQPGITNDPTPTQDGQSTGNPTGTAQSEWPMYQFDSANTGFRPTPLSSTSDIRRDWNASLKTPGPPVVANSTVYVPDETGIHAFDAESGTEQWVYEQEKSYGGEGYRATAVVGGTVYAPRGNALYALDAATGDQQWQFNGGREMSMPSIVNETVYVTSGRVLYARDAATGDPQWSYRAETALSSGQVFLAKPTVPPEGENVYVMSQYGERGGEEYDSKVIAVEKSNQTKHWTHSGPIFADPTGMASGMDSNVYVHWLMPSSTANELHVWKYNERGQEEWTKQYTLGGSETVGRYSAAVTRESVFFNKDSSRLTAVDPESGNEKWNYNIKDARYGSPVVAGKTVYIVGGSGPATLYALDTQRGSPKWTHSLPIGKNATPAVANGRLYINGADKLYALRGS